MPTTGFCFAISDRNKFSVIFGLSNNILKQKYRTSVVKSSSGSPVWNEESAM